jgi:leader peptidase (prepilin peptidase)/N-methyltransferase
VPTLSELPHALAVGFAVALGLLFGSFLNVVIHRLPRGQSLMRPRSRCPGCGQMIGARDNIPVLSWLWLRGRARCCGARISVRYPLVELIGGLLGWGIWRALIEPLGADVSLGRAALLFSLYLALALGLVAAAFIDLEHMFLPDEVTLGGTVLGLVTAGLRTEVSLLESGFGAAFGFILIWLPFDLCYRALRGQPGMGLGDAKLVMLAGAWFGWMGAVFALLAGAVQGTLGALGLFLVHGKIEEPEAVRRERQELLEQIENASELERAELERELGRDPLGREADPGIGKARLAFGPFLVLATLEFLLFGNFLTELFFGWGAS